MGRREKDKPSSFYPVLRWKILMCFYRNTGDQVKGPKITVFLSVWMLILFSSQGLEAVEVIEHEDPFIRGRLWDHGLIPYVIRPGFTARGLQSFKRAIEQFNNKTPVKFTPRHNEEHFVIFAPVDKSIESLSTEILGMQLGPQELILDRNTKTAPLVHQLGHLVGLKHESQDLNSIMNTRNKNHYRLSRKDIDALKNAYGKRPIFAHWNHSDCIDREKFQGQCAQLARNEGCFKSENLEKAYKVCGSTCGLCKSRKKNHHCQNFRASDFCQLGVSLNMCPLSDFNYYCAKSCGKCESQVGGSDSKSFFSDEEEWCSGWLRQGLCLKDLVVKELCTKSCSVYEKYLNLWPSNP